MTGRKFSNRQIKPEIIRKRVEDAKEFRRKYPLEKFYYKTFRLIETE